MKTFDYIPETAEELVSLKDYHALSVYDTISRIRELEREDSDKIEIPGVPSIPKLHTFYKNVNSPSSKELRKYDDAVEVYEKDKRKYDNAWKKRRDMQKNAGPILEEFIKLESGFYKMIPKKNQEKVWRKAWEDGHSSGYSEVYNELLDLIEIFV